ncbi:MAG: hypothetical protein U5L45_15530 [Saprospiraceae bacterium]|nr:hypothetical protein [Saprospiraceae bacterium]
MPNRELKGILAACFAFFALCCYIALRYNGTGDSGDAVQHFLYAKYAFAHPENLFNHWAKPLFTLIAAPFAQFGFLGIKIFNSLNAALTLYFTYRIAEKLRLPHAWLAVLILATCSQFFTLIFSGLTEHFSALLLVGVIWLFLCKEYLWATVIVSFLPFVRSEGLLLIGVTGLFLLAEKRWRVLPLLAVGHLVYSVVGWFFFHDFLWVFNKIPYAALSAYGHGTWYHFIEKLYYGTGLPQYILWIFGILGVFFYIFEKKQTPQYKRLWGLIWGYFFILLIAHSLFWYLGIFNSFGLVRVMNTVMPEFALIALVGFNFLTDLFSSEKLKFGVQILLVAAVGLMPFTRNPAAIFFPKMFVKTPDQIVLSEINQDIKEKMPSYCVLYANPCVPFYFKTDPYDPSVSRLITHLNDTDLPEKTLIVWDNVFSVLDHAISLDTLRQDAHFEEIRSWQTTDNKFQFTIFKKR